MVDVVIIGGGPAGLTAGTVLQRKGYKTCIIDCQVFPREKLCAGVLTTKSIELLKKIFKGISLEKLALKNINKITLLYNTRVIGEYTVSNAYSVINRKIFDNELLQYYRQVGGVIFEGEKKYEILYDKNMIRLDDGKTVQYHCLIGADGINSKVRRYVQHSWKASILCFEEFIPNISNEDNIQIDFGGVLGGYFWRIPCEDRIGIGLGELYIKGMKRNPRKYKSFFGKNGIEKKENFKGAFVSCGHFVRKPIKDNVLLVGDAAGLVDAMTGEGIFFAMESGKQAAVTIVNYFERGESLNAYLRRINTIHSKMREQCVYNKFLYAPIIRRLSLQYIRKNSKFVFRVLNNVIPTYRTGYTQEILKNIKRKIKNR